TIFSQIASTPVIVLSSSDHKLSSGVKWFPEASFGNNVFFAKDLNEAYNIAQQILKRNGEITINPPYFQETYFSKLKIILEILHIIIMKVLSVEVTVYINCLQHGFDGDGWKDFLEYIIKRIYDILLIVAFETRLPTHMVKSINGVQTFPLKPKFT